MRSTLIPLGLVCACASLARADFNPIPLTPGSFNADVVVEKTAPPPVNNYVNATMDGGTNNNAWVWYEQGYNAVQAWSGAPAHGAIFAAAENANHVFQMPADYTVNNALCIFSNANNAGFPTGRLTLTTPTNFVSLSLLNAGGGSSTINYTIHHSGGGADEIGTLSILDWFNTTAGNPFAWYSSGRVNMDSGVLGSVNLVGTGSPRLFYADIPLGDQVNPVTSIDFSTTSGSRAVFFGLSGSTNAVNFDPVAVTGFNRDMIIEMGATPPSVFFNTATVTLDRGPYLFGYDYYETGFGGQTTTGLPHPGTSFTVGTHTFTMAPSYTNNDCAFVGPYVGFTNATLTLSNPAAYLALSFLNASGNGAVPINVTVTHQAPGGTEDLSFSSLDWFNAATPAYANGGRFRLEDGNFDIRTGSKVFLNDLTLADTNNPVISVTFTYNGTGAGRTAIFAISGQTVSGGSYSPIGVSGYNADCVVEASAVRRPVNLYTSVTASMDGGTNRTGATWFEQGYYSVMPLAGLPAPGATITSLTLPDHRYQMPADYTANNAIYVDALNTTANLTPLYPTNAFSALSFLNSCANGSVSNQIVIQYADGTSETNLFIGQDWFNNTPYALSSYGRVNNDNRTFDNVPGRTTTPNPRLYEAQFFLANFTSPVTNIALTYFNPTTSGGREVVLAVSAATGPVGPIISANPVSTGIFVETSNVTFSVGSVLGTLPMTNQWQFSPVGGSTWNNLSDGGQITGATTPTLSINAAGVPNNGTYRLIASNPVGTNVSGSATITALSGLPAIPLPGDPITAVGLNPDTGAQGPASSIDNTLQKYLSFGGNNGSPFLGPIGFVVAPSRGASAIKAVRIYAANDASERDPADYTLEGSKDGGVTWTVISANSVSLSTTRNPGTGPFSPLTNVMQEFDFYGHNSAYFSYRVSVNNVRNNSTANSCQFAEFQLLGVLTSAPPVIVRQPLANVTNYVGGSPTFGLAALGTPISYQWYRGGSPIAGATGSAYTTNNVQLSDSGSTFYCVVSNSLDQVTSSSILLTVIPAPSTPYESVILADQPAAYWPLSEGPDDFSGNQGRAAVEYMGAHNGVYTNVVLGATGFNTNASPNTAVTFGSFATSDSFAGNIQDLTFAAPPNTATATFSVEAWVLNSPSTAQTTDAGLVTKGYGGGGEQFNLDCGSGGAARLFRFFVRDAAGATHGANGTIGSTTASGPFPNANGANMSWHHVVGVYDAPHSNVVLYVDGILNAITRGPLTNGVLTSVSPVSIGSRQSASGGAYNNQFSGTMEAVAIYNVALSSNQVLNHYFAAQPLPVFSIQPTNTMAAEGGPVTLYSSAYGPPALTYQWYQSADGTTFAALAGQTNNNLFFATTSITWNGYQYYVAATDPYGSITSSVATLSVVSGPPFVLPGEDLPPITVVYAGATVSLRVGVGGTAPFTYGWTTNGVPLNDGGRISGAHSNVLTIANAILSDSATYQLFMTNTYGQGNSSPSFLYVETTPDFNTNGLGWTANGGATFANNVLTLTEAVNSQARSAWYNYQLYIGCFYASWIYQDVTVGGADGMAFCVQNDPDGTAALGAAGGALALSGIAPSAALTFNVYNGAGISFGVNGGNGSPYHSTAPVAIDSGDPIYVSLLYDGTTMYLTLEETNLVSGPLTFTTNLVIGSLPTLLGGNTAYVGFTAATGGINANQTVSDFVFIPLPALTVQKTGPTAVVLSWPAAIGGYVLQSTTTLSAPNWQNVPAPVTVIGGQNEVTVSPLAADQFFRLVLTDTAP